MSGKPTIVFIHGAWMTPKCWDKFIPYFENAGYKCLAPAWPFKEGNVEMQQNNPDERLKNLRIDDIVDHYAEIIEKMDEPPVLIGHSFGGLFVQMLLDRGLGSAGVAIDSAPPRSVFPYYISAIRANFWILKNPLNQKKVLRISPKNFNYAFIHTLSEEEQKQVYEKYVVPESGKIFFEAAFSKFNGKAKVNFKNDTRSPLLMISGKEDKIIPNKMNRGNFKKYAHSAARTDFKEFEGRTHWIIALDGWEDVASYISNWISEL